MSLRPASFKGTAFYVEDTEGEFGRRNVLHQYPYRDLPYGEDLGRDARGFSFTAFVLTRDACDALIETLESDGSGTLIHPWYGSTFVQHDGKARVQYPLAEGGRFGFQLHFVEAGENTEPDASEDAGSLLDGLVNDALSMVGADFAAKWTGQVSGWLDVAGQRLDAVLGAVEKYLGPVEQGVAAVRGLVYGAGGLLAKPLELYYRIAGLVRTVMNLNPLPFGGRFGLSFSGVAGRSTVFQAAPEKKTDALLYVSGDNDHESTFSISSAVGAMPANPFAGAGIWPAFIRQPAFKPLPRDKQATLAILRGDAPAVERPAWAMPPENEDALPALPPALADVVRRVVVLEAARALVTAPFISHTDIESARDEVLATLDVEMNAATDALYPALQAVRMQVGRLVQNRLPAIHELAIIDNRVTLPALLLAYRVNGSIGSADDLVARNRVRHPGFVPAGRVEVLRDE